MYETRKNILLEEKNDESVFNRYSRLSVYLTFQQ